MSKNAIERKDAYGVLKLMAEVDGYVMVRRPNCMPFVLSKREWEALLSPALYDELLRPYNEAVAKAWTEPGTSLAGH